MDLMPVPSVEYNVDSLTGTSEPLENTLYLWSAVETIADSLQDRSSTSIHDLLDAYNTFSNRIRSQSQVLKKCDKRFPAFDCVVHHKAALIQALRRDIGLAHIDPLFIPSRTRSSYGDSFDDPGITSVRTDTRQYARNTSLLCNHALCSLAVIIKFPAFNSLFTVVELSELLGDVLHITQAQTLPILNSAKTFSLSLLILGSHRLPLESVIPLSAEIPAALRRTLEGPDPTASNALDGLKALSHNLEHYASDLFVPSSHLLPLILPFLLYKSPDIRLYASIVLGRLAAVLVREGPLTQNWKAISEHVLCFLDLHCSNASSCDDENLSQVAQTACSVESQTRPGEGATWMLALFASLIILCGPSLFANCRVLMFILHCLGLTLTHQRSVVRALHPHVWKCLVWVFFRMISTTENVGQAEICRVLFVIKQEVGGGVGVTLTAILLHFARHLHGRSSEFTTYALSVLQVMVQSDDKHTFQDGALLLHVMTVDTGRLGSSQRSSRAFDDMLSPALFDGGVISADWRYLPLIIRSMPKTPVSSVRPLNSAEIVVHYKSLVDIWQHCARKQPKGILNTDLIDAWQSIVSALSQFTGDGCSLTNPSWPVELLATVVIEFLPPLPHPDIEPQWGSWDVRDQQCRLATMNQLWSVMQNTLVPSRLFGPAETILVSILKFAFHILDVEVKALWSHLCANLMVSASPSFLSDMHNLSESQMAVRTQRGLWGVVVKSLTSSKSDFHWEDLVRFLAIPVCNWTLSDSELEAWSFMLQNAVPSGVPSIPFAFVVEAFMKCIEGRGANDWVSMPALLGVIITRLQTQGIVPPDVVLRYIDNSLISSYGRALRSPDSVSLSLGLLTSLRDYIIISSPTQVLHLLVALRRCLEIWIEDRSEVVAVEDFNTLVISLYRDSLDILARCPLSIETLQDLEAFLTSGFSRIPAPAIGPFAFEKFWRATYHGQRQFYDALPARIKSCLICFSAAYGGDLAVGLSLPMDESQSQSASNGPESQLSPTYPSLPYISWGLRKLEQLDEVLDDQNVQTPEVTSLPPEDTAFLVASSDDESSQPSVFHHFQESPRGEHSSPSDKSPGDTPQDSESFLSALSVPSRGSPLSVEERDRKRKQLARADTPKKRNRTSRYTRRKANSEPVQGDAAPSIAPRIKSVPVTPRKTTFDGIELPTLRDILRLEGPSLTQRSNRQPTRSSEHYDSPISEVHIEDEDDFDDWERTAQFDGTSSEVEIEKSLVAGYPSSTPSQNTRVHASGVRATASMTPRRRKSQSESSPSSPRRAPLRRSNTTSARLDALRDVYASVANGASQIPATELLQATRLVHQIGAVLTEQMGKKFGSSR